MSSSELMIQVRFEITIDLFLPSSSYHMIRIPWSKPFTEVLLFLQMLLLIWLHIYVLVVQTSFKFKKTCSSGFHIATLALIDVRNRAFSFLETVNAKPVSHSPKTIQCTTNLSYKLVAPRTTNDKWSWKNFRKKNARCNLNLFFCLFFALRNQRISISNRSR